MTIAIQLILSGYGTWLPNDLRGSGSDETLKHELELLGPVHHGRKPAHLQPSRHELRAFYREAEPRLEYETLWFRSELERSAIATAFGEVIKLIGYTVWACAVCVNHSHILVRIHRDDAVTMWDNFANASRLAITKLRNLPNGHPVWSSRPYRVYLETPDAVWSEIDYIWKNPMKEGLAEQRWDFVQPYNNWPRHKGKK
jgi:REP element-mobilizing transposase RayT